MKYAWVVLNQSQTPPFQQMLERVAGDESCLILTGTPFPTERPNVRVEAAPPYDRRGVRHRLLSWARYTAVALERTARLRGNPFVLAVTNPPMLPHLAWALSRVRKLRYGLLIWDIYPHHLVQMGWFKERSPAVQAWHALNRAALANAEVVITLTEQMAGTLREELGSHTRIEIVPNWADTDVLRPLGKQENPFVLEHHLNNKLVVMYSGNIGATHGLDGLVSAAEQLRSEPRIHFVAVGSGLGRDALDARLAEKRLANFTLLPPQPWESFPHSLAAGDVAVVSQSPGTEHLSIPSKTYSALAAGSAILALTAPDSDLAKLVRGRDVGITCPRDDTQAIRDTLRELVANPRRLAQLRRNARSLAESEFSAHVTEVRLKNLLRPHFSSTAGTPQSRKR